ncbi:MAG: bifunctional UDP-sugar hydrolase/5'-nucleotidase [bacterium]
MVLTRNRSRFIRIVLAVGIAALAAGRPAGADPVAQAPGPFDLTLFHTNDGHSHFLPRPAAWRDDGRMVGGVIPLAWHLQDQRRTAPADVFVDAGDFLTGNPVCTLEEDGVPGYAVADMMTLLGYDAGVVGNHEFDIGLTSLDRLVPRFGFPVMALDILGPDGGAHFPSEPLILDRGGLRIGILAVSCGGMEEVVTASRMGGLVMGDQVEIVRREAAALDPVTDLIVLLSHNGVDGDKELAANLTGAGVDVIVGGHSHTRLKEPLLENGIIIVQAGSKLTDLGRLDLRVENDEVTAFHGRLVTTWSDGTFAGPELTALVTGLENRVHEVYGRKIGTLTTDLTKGPGETVLGNWLADILRARAGADVALINTGGIRKELRAGPLTALDIHEILPFANALITMELTGRELAAVVQRNADSGVGGGHGILQVSGLRYSYRPAPDGKTAVVEEILVGAKPLDTGGVYSVALPDYVASMAHVYLNIDVPAVYDSGVTLTQVVIEAVEAAGEVGSALDGRITELQ